MLRSNRYLLSLSVAFAVTTRVAQAQDAPIGPASSPTNSAPAPSETAVSGEQNSLSGSSGLLHLQAAGSDAAGTVRLSLLADGYSGSGFLCNSGTPCTGSSRDSVSHFGTSLGLSITPLAGLEAYASLHSFANSDDQHSPGLLEVLNNTSLGVKGFLPQPLFGLLKLGGSADVSLLSGSGAVGFSGKSTSARLTALAELDLDGPTHNALPLRILTNVGYFLDNSGALVESVENSRGTPITRVERFGLGINRVDRVELGLGVEGRFKVARPFVEWNLAVPVNRQGYTCVPRRSFVGDGCLATDDSLSAFPSTLTVGTRVSPFSNALTGTVAVDVGLAGTSNFIEELAPTLPWDIWLGVSYAFDMNAPPERIVLQQVPAPAVPPKPVLRVQGFVHEKGNSNGLADAVVRYSGQHLTAMVSDANGRFVSDVLEPGNYTFAVTLDGYRPGECQVAVSEHADAPSRSGASPMSAEAPPSPKRSADFFDTDCALEALPRTGTVSGRVIDLDTGSPIAATVEMTDSLHRNLKLNTDANGAFRFEQVLPGVVTLAAEAPQYLFHTQSLTLRPREDARPEVQLHKRPKVSLVQVSATELRIKQQVHFAQDSPAILGDSNALLEQIADTLARTPTITHLEIQGHTDNTGTPEHNKSLSEARASAVLDWLVEHGIDASRLSASGYGQERPLSPNITPQGRARNRRVQFVIVH